MYSDKLPEAFRLAHELHRDQVRKGTGVPYITHLMAVAAAVGRYGGSEAQVVAALLHDAVEDQGGLPTLEAIRAGFGEQVARYVDGCSDSYETPKPPWLERKKAYIEKLPGEPPEVKLISAADKLDNVRNISADLREHGDAIWDRFNAGRDGTVWYYEKVFEVLRTTWNHPILDELKRAVADLSAAAGRRQ